MTYKEALKLLKDYEYWADVSPIFETYNLAIEALEKQIPKKPTQIETQTCTCPTCSHRIIKGDYCSDCGQKLDWGDEE